MITYMDRVIISTALPVIRQEFGLSLVAQAGSSEAFTGRTRCSSFRRLAGRPIRAAACIDGDCQLVERLHRTYRTRLERPSMIGIQFLFGMGEADMSIATRLALLDGCCRGNEAMRRGSRTRGRGWAPL